MKPSFSCLPHYLILYIERKIKVKFSINFILHYFWHLHKQHILIFGPHLWAGFSKKKKKKDDLVEVQIMFN